LKYKLQPGYTFINGSNLNGIKTKTLKDGKLERLLQFLNVTELKIDNITKFIISIYKKVKIDDYSEDILNLLRDMINLGLDNPIMRSNWEQSELNFLVETYEHYCRQFNNVTQAKLMKLINYKMVDGIAIDMNETSAKSNYTGIQGFEDKVSQIVTDILTKFNTNINTNIITHEATNEQLNTNNSFKNDSIYFNYQKILMAKHHINIMRLHIDAKTTPASLFFNRFPQPFYAHDNDFVEKYNSRIIEFQTNVMNDIIEFSQSKIVKFENDLNNHINLIANKPIDFNSIIENKYKQIEFEKRDYFESKMNKARRCISKPFRVFIKSKNTKDNNNTSVCHNSTLNQSSSSHPYVNSSFNGNNNNHNSNANSPSEFTNHSNRSDNFNNRLISTPNRNKKLSNNNHYNGGRYSNYQENNYNSRRVGFRQ
jgi:hypothetical protein